MSTNNLKNNQHHRELIASTLDAAGYNGHGHVVGKQGNAGHAMPDSDHAAQGRHAYVPRGVLFSDAGQASQGGFTGSGMTGEASNATYSTSSADGVGDADSGSPSRD